MDVKAAESLAVSHTLTYTYTLSLTHTIAPINSLVVILSFYSRTILQHSAYRLLFRAYENDTGVKYTVDIIIIIITG